MSLMLNTLYNIHCMIYTVWYTLFVYIYHLPLLHLVAKHCTELYFLRLLGSIQQSESISFMRDSLRTDASQCQSPRPLFLNILTFGIIVIVLNLAERATAIETDLVILLSLWFSINLATFRPCLAKLLLTPLHNQALHAKDTAERFRRLTMTS